MQLIEVPEPSLPPSGTDASPESFLDFLLDAHIVERAAAERVRAASRSSGQAIDVVLVQLGLLAEAKLADAFADFLRLERVKPAEFPAELPPEEEIPRRFLRTTGLLPLAMSEDAIVVASARPLEPGPARALGFFLKRSVDLKIAVASEIAKHLERLLERDDDAAETERGTGLIEEDVERLKDFAREAPIIRLVNRLIAGASERKASDIHIESLEDRLRVRFRIDGVLQTMEALPKQMQAGVVSRIKILAKLNIAERRLPQDGRIKMPVRGRDLDLRVSTVPALYGESVVLRLLDRRDVALDFAALGFSDAGAAKLNDLISHPNGIVLVTGPTGSGKTTTLYAALARLNRPESKLITVEDPIEYHLAGCSQIHVNPQIGLDFASVLRSILRQDPDIIMVGEIRDAETARIAVQASLTGHLVLSTLHTNSASAAITRLADMGIEDYLIVSSLRGILSQRLVRRLCPACKEPRGHYFRASGCGSCFGTGYSGRIAIYELLTINAALARLIMAHASAAEIEAQARADGMIPLHDCGMALAASGQTSAEEVIRVVGGSE